MACKKWFVYYCDDYESQGLEEFDTEREALAFVNERLSNDHQNWNEPESYTVIEGWKHELEPIKVVREVKLCR